MERIRRLGWGSASATRNFPASAPGIWNAPPPTRRATSFSSPGPHRPKAGSELRSLTSGSPKRSTRRLPAFIKGLPRSRRKPVIPTGPSPKSRRFEIVPCDRRQQKCWFEPGAFDQIVAASEFAPGPESLCWRARAFAETAKEAHRRLLALPPSSAAYRLVGTIEDLAGNPRCAVDAWRWAVELQPGNLSVRVGLLRALTETGLHEE